MFDEFIIERKKFNMEEFKKKESDLKHLTGYFNWLFTNQKDLMESILMFINNKYLKEYKENFIRGTATLFYTDDFVFLQFIFKTKNGRIKIFDNTDYYEKLIFQEIINIIIKYKIKNQGYYTDLLYNNYFKVYDDLFKRYRYNDILMEYVYAMFEYDLHLFIDKLINETAIRLDYYDLIKNNKNNLYLIRYTIKIYNTIYKNTLKMINKDIYKTYNKLFIKRLFKHYPKLLKYCIVVKK